MRITHIKNRLEQQLTIIDLIANSYDNLTKVGLQLITSQRINARIIELKENWEQFSLVHNAITSAINELDSEDRLIIQDHSYFVDNLFSLTHECYLEALEKMNSLLETTQQTITRTTSVQSLSNNNSHPPTFVQHTSLPRINIPKFNGTPADWLSFKDLFSSLVVANPTLTPVEKLQYLKTSLVGSAAHLIKNTALTADNYQKAWDALISFYENKRLLVNAALHSLLSIKRMTKESANEMETLYTSIMEVYRTLETLQRPVSTWDDFLVFIAVQRLDSESVKAWEQHLGSSKEPPSWTTFSEFLVTRLLSLQAFEKSRTGKPNPQAHRNTARTHYQGNQKENVPINDNSCPICSSKHYISFCPQYTQKTVQQRLTLIEKHKLCFNCLGRHRAANCRVTRRCQKCGRKHHTTIHQANKSSAKSETITSKQGENTKPKLLEAQTLHAAVEDISTSCHIFLATAQVILTQNGQSVKARALIDQGSEISLISERMVQLLKLPRHRLSLLLNGIGTQKSNKTKGITSFNLKPHFETDLECTFSAHILPKLTTLIPSANLNQQSWPYLQGLQLADPEFLSPGVIDVILGADVYSQIIEEGLIRDTLDSPIAQCTKLGWIISGPTNSRISQDHAHGFHISIDNELHELLQQFWKLEEVPTSSTSKLSLEEQECENHFASTHSRDSTGRYIVRLPFKLSPTKLGDSKNKAFRMITNLSKRLASNSNYSQEYSKFMSEYELHHMQRFSASQPEPQNVYYLPHHGVLRESSHTTKLRVVFNGSSNTTSGVSLNQLLHTGEKLQSDLLDVLISFRTFCYVFSSDVEKMCRQIQVHPEDWNYQRIFWFDSSNNIVIYALTTVTYGLACAPYLALRTFKQLTIDEGANFPLAVPTIEKGRYVDDIFGGADTIEESREKTSKSALHGGRFSASQMD